MLKCMFFLIVLSRGRKLFFLYRQRSEAPKAESCLFKKFYSHFTLIFITDDLSLQNLQSYTSILVAVEGDELKCPEWCFLMTGTYLLSSGWHHLKSKYEQVKWTEIRIRDWGK